MGVCVHCSANVFMIIQSGAFFLFRYCSDKRIMAFISDLVCLLFIDAQHFHIFISLLPAFGGHYFQVYIYILLYMCVSRFEGKTSFTSLMWKRLARGHELFDASTKPSQRSDGISTIAHMSTVPKKPGKLNMPNLQTTNDQTNINETNDGAISEMF